MALTQKTVFHYYHLFCWKEVVIQSFKDAQWWHGNEENFVVVTLDRELKAFKNKIERVASENLMVLLTHSHS